MYNDAMLLEAKILCPHCGFSKEETMPTAYSEDRYECTRCHAILKPKKGECCVFCSYSNTVCPPVQEKRDCCSG